MHTVSTELKSKVDARIKECVRLSGIDCGDITVRYDINSKRTGGMAYAGQNLIRLNPVYLNAHTDHYIKQTVAHEFAHIAARKHYGRFISSHGPEWKSIMVKMGISPNRCHSYTVPEGVALGRQVTKYELACDCCSYTTQVGGKIRNKILNGSTYRHRGCPRGKLVLVNRSTKPQPQPVLTGTGASKVDKCRFIYQANRSLSRAALIQLFVSQAGCTPAGASSYYQKLKDQL